MFERKVVISAQYYTYGKTSPALSDCFLDNGSTMHGVQVRRRLNQMQIASPLNPSSMHSYRASSKVMIPPLPPTETNLILSQLTHSPTSIQPTTLRTFPVLPDLTQRSAYTPQHPTTQHYHHHHHHHSPAQAQAVRQGTPGISPTSSSPQPSPPSSSANP